MITYKEPVMLLKSLLTILSLMLFTACSIYSYDHPPPGVSVKQWNRDLFECKQAAVRYIAPGGYYDNFTTSYYQSAGGSYEDDSVVNECMHAKGYRQSQTKISTSLGERDLSECKQAAAHQSTGGSDEESFAVRECMHAKGYVRY